MTRFFSSIAPELKRRTLLKGTVFAALGALLLLWGGAGLDLPTLSKWGWLIFLVAIGLIALGLIPYRRLNRLENNPYELRVDNQAITLLHQGNKLFAYPIDAISRVGYYKRDDLYGIKIWLKEGLEKKHYGADIFLPYFSERSYKEFSGYFLD